MCGWVPRHRKRSAQTHNAISDKQKTRWATQNASDKQSSPFSRAARLLEGAGPIGSRAERVI